MSFQDVTYIEASKLFVDPKLKELLNILTKEQRDTFREEIRTQGIQDPLDVDLKTGRIYDGINRFEIGTELGLSKYPVIKWTFASEEEAIDFVIRKNLARRQMNEAQRVAAALKLEENEKKLAEKRKLAGVTLGQNEPKGKTRDILAKKAKVSSTTFHKISSVLKGDNQELKNNLLSGKTKPDRAYTTHVKNTRILEKIEIPKGEFNLIVLDLPLEFKMKLRGSPGEHYQAYEEIDDYLKDFPVEKIPMAKNCIVVFWSWPSRTRDVQKVMYAYGLKEITAAVWVKTTLDNKKFSIGMGTRFRSCHENLIICEKGKPPVPDEANRPKSVFLAPVNPKNHSEKPDKAYEMLNRMYPTLEKKLDFFGRKEREGFTVFGNQKTLNNSIIIKTHGKNTKS